MQLPAGDVGRHRSTLAWGVRLAGRGALHSIWLQLTNQVEDLMENEVAESTRHVGPAKAVCLA